MSRLAILVPVHDGGPRFKACLDGIAALDPQPDEVIVVDDGSRDGSAEEAAARGLKVVRFPQRLGPAAARNAATRSTCADLLFFVDSDVVLPPDAVTRMVRTFAQRDAPAAAFGSYDDRPAAPGVVSQYRNLLHHFVHQTSRVNASTFWAGAGAIRREVFLELGGFDESYHEASIEDIELGLRLNRGGHAVRLVKDLQVTHLKQWTLSSFVYTDLHRRALPWSRLILAARHMPNDLNLGLSMRWSVVAAVTLLGAGLLAPWLATEAVAAGAGLALLGLNAPFGEFLLKSRGPVFLVQAAVLHWLHYLIGGAGFAWAVAERSWRVLLPPPARATRGLPEVSD